MPMLPSQRTARQRAALNEAREKLRSPLHGSPGKIGIYQPMERMVRPFVEVGVSERTIREPKAPDLDRPEAFIEWGAAAQFTSDTFRSDARRVGFQVDDDEEPERVRHSFSEEGRAWKDYMVLSADDPDAYIIQRQATQISLSGPDGAQFLLHLRPSPPGTQTGSGQTPPSPPLDEM